MRARRRRIWTAAAAAAVTLGVALGAGLLRPGAPAPTAAPAAHVELVSDSAWAQATNAAPVALRPGDEIKVGAELATEERGRLALRLATGHSVRLDAATRLKVLADRAIALESGAVYVDSRHPSGRTVGFVEVRTPLATIRDIGTQFEVRRLTGAVRVRVREGRIRLEGAGNRVEAAAGHELELAANGRLARRDWSVWDPELEWASGITPMLDLEGRSLREFLDWLARERGLRLEFASREAASSAPRITLNGSIDGMTLDQALESVLLTCRMAHRIDGGALIVRFSTEVPSTP